MRLGTGIRIRVQQSRSERFRALKERSNQEVLPTHEGWSFNRMGILGTLRALRTSRVSVGICRRIWSIRIGAELVRMLLEINGSHPEEE